jgi:hypothetical protein
MDVSSSPGVRFYAQKDAVMEYLGIAGAWKKAEDFAVTDPNSLMVAAVVGAVILIFLIRWLIKK